MKEGPDEHYEISGGDPEKSRSYEGATTVPSEVPLNVSAAQVPADTVTIELSADDETEDLVNFMLSQLSDDQIDEISVRRDFDRPNGLASEPVTVLVVLGIALPTVAVTIGRLAERWLETRRQKAHVRMVVETYHESPELAKLVAKVTAEHANVAARYKLASVPTTRGRPSQASSLSFPSEMVYLNREGSYTADFIC